MSVCPEESPGDRSIYRTLPVHDRPPTSDGLSRCCLGKGTEPLEPGGFQGDSRGRDPLGGVDQSEDVDGRHGGFSSSQNRGRIIKSLQGPRVGVGRSGGSKRNSEFIVFKTLKGTQKIIPL